MAPTKDKAPPPSSKPAKSGGGKQKKKKFNRGKQKEKVNNLVLFDQASYDKLISEAPSTSLLLLQSCLTDLGRTICQFPRHQGAVCGFSASTDGHVLVSCGTDCTVILWNVPNSSVVSMDESSDGSTEPLVVYVWKNAFWIVDHQWGGDQFETAGAQVDIWDHNRSEPIRSFEWGKDIVISLQFNLREPNILATSGRMDIDKNLGWWLCERKVKSGRETTNPSRRSHVYSVDATKITH